MLKAPNNLLDTDYVISSIRQGMTAENVLLVDTKDEAELIAESPCREPWDSTGTTSLMEFRPAVRCRALVRLRERRFQLFRKCLSEDARQNWVLPKWLCSLMSKRLMNPTGSQELQGHTSTSRDTWFLGDRSMAGWEQSMKEPDLAGARTSRLWGMPQNRVMPRGPSYEEFRGTKLFAAAVEKNEKTGQS